MSPLTFAVSTATHNSAQTSSYFIPGQPFLETFMPFSYRTTHLWVTTSFLSLNSKHDFCYVYSEAYPAQTTSHFNSAYLFWRPLFLTPKSTRLQTTGNSPKCLLDPFIPVFLLTTPTSTKGLLSTQVLSNF